MKLANLDLNLLLSLHALLQERSVTRAAERLVVGQPAMSTRLSRLRAYFSDPLLERDGQEYVLTPLAQRLLVRTETALSDIELVFNEHEPFDPATSTAELRIGMSDYAAHFIGARLGRMMAERAPGMRLRIELFGNRIVNNLAEAPRIFDAILVGHGLLGELPYSDLFRDEWVAVVGRANTTVGDCVTQEELLTMPWIVSYDISPVIQSLRSHGAHQDARIHVDSFLAVPALIADSDRVAALPGRVAAEAAEARLVRVVSCDLGLPPLVEAIWWHPIHQSDPTHRWFRETLVEVVADIDAHAAS